MKKKSVETKSRRIKRIIKFLRIEAENPIDKKFLKKTIHTPKILRASERFGLS